jgi:hypothetical protein
MKALLILGHELSHQMSAYIGGTISWLIRFSGCLSAIAYTELTLH